MSSPSFLVQVTHRQHGGRKAEHVVPFIAAPVPGRNAFRLAHGPKAFAEAERFPSPKAAEAALLTLPDYPTRIGYEIAPEADSAKTHATA